MREFFHPTLLALLIIGAGGVLGQRSTYAPNLSICPSSLITRTGSPLDGGQALTVEESAYLQHRRANVLPSLRAAYLSKSITGVTGYDTSTLVAHNPRVSIAVSGGGYRAALFGAATLSALDSRNASHIAPLLDVSDFLAGLSGGSWLVGSLALNDMPDLYSLVLGGAGYDGWKMDRDIISPADSLVEDLKNDDGVYQNHLKADVQSTADAGFPTSIIDLWGRAISMHFFNGTTRANFFSDVAHDRGLLWSSIKYTSNFQAYTMPLPIVTSTSRVNSSDQSLDLADNLIPLGNTQFEFTPFAFGSFDHSLMAHVPIEYAGTRLNDGAPANSSACAVGYDNAGTTFILGTSAALFNLLDTIKEDVEDLLNPFKIMLKNTTPPSSSIPLVANWPNSFKNFSPAAGTAFESAADDILELSDGGEDGQNLPLGPLLVKSRSQDLLFAVDGSADTSSVAVVTKGWPNGASIIATADRVANYSGGLTSFPPVPLTTAEFISQGLNTRPTFFGCNTTGNGETSVVENYPLVIYLANAPAPNAGSDTPTYQATGKSDYTVKEQLAFLGAGQANALKGFQSGTSLSDPEWPLALKWTGLANVLG